MSAKIICGVLGAAAALGGVVVYLTGAVVPGFILITGGVLVSLIPSLVETRGQDVKQYNEKHKTASMLCMIFIAALMTVMFAITRDAFFLISLVVGCSYFLDGGTLFAGSTKRRNDV